MPATATDRKTYRDFRPLRAAFLLAALTTAWACSDFLTGIGDGDERILRTLRLNHPEVSLHAADTVRFSITALDQHQQPFDSLPPEITLSWATSDIAVASVDSTGLVLARRPGQSLVTATVAGPRTEASISARVTVYIDSVVVRTVSALLALSDTTHHGTVGDTIADPLLVRALAQDGAPVADVAIEFLAEDDAGAATPAVVTTDSAGLAAARWALGPRPGEQRLVARVVGSDVAPVHFTAHAAAGPLARIAIAPDTATLTSPGDTVRLEATGADRFDNPLALHPAWTSLDTAVATVDSAGLVTAVGAGAARIVASTAGIADTALVTILTGSRSEVDPYEPNDTRESAWSIHAPPDPLLNALTGKAGLPFLTIFSEERAPAIEHAGDIDFFAFKLDRAASVYIQLENRGDAGTLRLELFEGILGQRHLFRPTVQPGKAEILVASLRGLAETELEEPIGEPGTYYVAVSAAEPAGKPIPYRLSITTDELANSDFIDGDLSTARDYNDFAVDAFLNAIRGEEWDLPRDVALEAMGRLRGPHGRPRDFDLYLFRTDAGGPITHLPPPPVIAITNMSEAEPIVLSLFPVGPDLEHSERPAQVVQVQPRTTRAIDVSEELGNTVLVALSAANPGATDIPYDICMGERCRMESTWAPEQRLDGRPGVRSADPFLVIVYDYYERRVPNAWVHFSANRGTLSATSVLTNENGEATVYFTPPNDEGNYEIQYWLTNAPQADPANRETLTYVAEYPVDKVYVDTRVATGESHTCAITDRDEAYCWGLGFEGRLGNGLESVATYPQRVDMRDTGPLIEISAGWGHTCALNPKGEAFCWGRNNAGQIGDGTYGTGTDKRIPARVDQSDAAPFSAIAAGTLHTCALDAAGQAYCWGNNSKGQIGDGTTMNYHFTPARVDQENVDGRFVQIVVGYHHTCALTDGGQVYCWGANDYRQLGSWQASNTPVALDQRATGPFKEIAAGYEHSCGVTADQRLFCWGRNDYGQLGRGTNGIFDNAIGVVDGRYASITAMGMRTCALDPEGQAYCWGETKYGPPGNGSTGDYFTRPVTVAQKETGPFTTISTGYYHTCAITTAGATYCWGRNASGELGIQSTEGPALYPTPVRWELSGRKP